MKSKQKKQGLEIDRKDKLIEHLKTKNEKYIE